MASNQQTIDHLLERYLALLDKYTHLRQQLSHLQASIFHDIARANFSGERGQRFGKDHYDQRMQASRRLEIRCRGGHHADFSVKRTRAGGEEEEGEGEPSSADSRTPDDGDGDEKPARQGGDPLRWFGILTPLPLRTAQLHSVRSVEEIIPRLVSVAAEMRHVEIEVRRARKRRAKAEGGVGVGVGVAEKVALRTEDVQAFA
ncbi:hypothetical protein C2857_001287 [Epichloe festucae Fl1]|uniref:Vacuolar ATPase assembly protein VMA22 n=1 Tax=Epichloe festucae (strain Fl1) TaxID=877507 RepID=A0A7U3SMZ1_EPIFF|nr:hypothetical protein C2857_001287 [Epichloe festucae Fl1]